MDLTHLRCSYSVFHNRKGHAGGKIQPLRKENCPTAAAAAAQFVTRPTAEFWPLAVAATPAAVP